MDPKTDLAKSDLNGLLRDGVITLTEWRNEVTLMREAPISQARTIVSKPKSCTACASGQGAS